MKKAENKKISDKQVRENNKSTWERLKILSGELQAIIFQHWKLDELNQELMNLQKGRRISEGNKKRPLKSSPFLTRVYAGFTLTACGPRLPSAMSNVTDCPSSKDL